MTKEKFQAGFSGEFAKFLASPCGQAMLNTLSEMIPPYEFAKDPHLFSENRGARRGYEHALRQLISLSVFTPAKKEIEATYGVPNQPTKEP